MCSNNYYVTNVSDNTITLADTATTITTGDTITVQGGVDYIYGTFKVDDASVFKITEPSYSIEWAPGKDAKIKELEKELSLVKKLAAKLLDTYCGGRE